LLDFFDWLDGLIPVKAEVVPSGEADCPIVSSEDRHVLYGKDRCTLLNVYKLTNEMRTLQIKNN
jgi:hypothetical protein